MCKIRGIFGDFGGGLGGFILYRFVGKGGFAGIWRGVW